MKGRIRTIKPEIALDEELWTLCERMPEAPVFQVYTMLWCYADREERFEWRPQALRAVCCPYWQGDFAGLLDALEQAGFLSRYTVDGKQYGLVRNLAKHQCFNAREPKSKLPPPSSVDMRADADTCMHVHARGEGKGTEREGNGKGTEVDPRKRDLDHSPESTITVRAEPTRPDNPKPALSETRTTSAPPLASPTQPRGAQEPHVPILRTREAVLAVPINERARWYLANQHQFFGGAADWAQPETWPEVLAPIQAFHEAGGLRPPRLHGYNRDYAVKNVIEHYAAGYTLEELLLAYRDVVTSDYYLDRKLKGHKPHASWVTAGVLQRQLEVESDGSAQLELARRQVEREKAAKAARLVAEVEHTQSLVTDEDDDEWDMPTAQLGPGPASRLLTGSGK